MLTRVAAEAVVADTTSHAHIIVLGLTDLRIVGSDMITMTYVLGVKMSMKAAKHEFLTSML